MTVLQVWDAMDRRVFLEISGDVLINLHSILFTPTPTSSSNFTSCSLPSDSSCPSGTLSTTFKFVRFRCRGNYNLRDRYRSDILRHGSEGREGFYWESSPLIDVSGFIFSISGVLESGSNADASASMGSFVKRPPVSGGRRNEERVDSFSRLGKSWGQGV